LLNYIIHKLIVWDKSYCCTVHFRKITSIYQPTNAHIISHKTLLKHFKTLRHVSILSDDRQGALFLAKVILQYSQFNSYLQTRCCGSIPCCVGMCCGTLARCASYMTHTYPMLHTTFPYLQTRCCGSISCCVVEQWLGVRHIQHTPSHGSTTHSYTTRYAATTPRLQIQIEL